MNFDHVALACPDLPAALDEVERAIGVRFGAGGQFPNDDSQNAVAAYGTAQYVGLIGPVSAPRPRTQGAELSELTRLQPYSLVYAGGDLLSIQRSLAQAGFKSLIEYRQRTNSFGELVRLHRLRVLNPSGGYRYRNTPMFLDWLDSPHPSAGAIATLDSVEFTIFDPAPDSFRLLLTAAGVAALPPIEKSEQPGASVTLRSGGRTFSTTMPAGQD